MRCRGTGPRGTASVQLIAPQSVFLDGRINIVNLNIGKRIQYGMIRIEPAVSLSNALNSNAPEVITVQYGPAWRNVFGIVPPLLLKFSVRVDF